MVITDLHSYDPAQGHGLRHDPFNAIIAPRPIGWISTKSSEGKLNLAPYSYFNAVSIKPPLIVFSTNAVLKDTIRNVRETGEFVWNLATRKLDAAMNATSRHAPRGVSEFELAGLTPVASTKVGAPRVGESPVAMECKLTEIFQLKNKDGQDVKVWLTLGEVVFVHIDSALVADGVYHTAAAHPIMRAGRRGDYFEVAQNLMFEMMRPD